LIQKKASLSRAEDSLAMAWVRRIALMTLSTLLSLSLARLFFVAQELFVVKGFGYRFNEAKDILIPFNNNVLAGV
jgi:hypothetical protein